MSEFHWGGLCSCQMYKYDQKFSRQKSIWDISEIILEYAGLISKYKYTLYILQREFSTG